MVTPIIEGAVPIRSAAGTFLQAFRQRVAAGLLSGRPHARSNYVVSDAGPDHLMVRAGDWRTAVNVGLNRLELRHVPPGEIHYRVRYWQWAWFVLGLSGLLGVAGLVLLLSGDARGYIERNQHAMVPGLTIEQNLLIAWLMVVFWGFVWPWLLIAMHKRPLRGLVERLVAEIDRAVSANR